MSITNLTAKQLHRAAFVRERIDELERELSGILNIASPAESGPAGRRKRTMSAAARAKIAAAQKARWARIRAGRKSA